MGDKGVTLCGTVSQLMMSRNASIVAFASTGRRAGGCNRGCVPFHGELLL